MKKVPKRPIIKPLKDPNAPSSNDYNDYPEDSFDLVNKYGTYEIQPTSDTSNIFPTIAQGLQNAEPKQRKNCDNRKNSK